MKKSLLSRRALLIALGSASAAAALSVSLPLFAEEEDGFVTLFDGKAEQLAENFTTTGNWLVEEDGTLAIKPREGETGWKRYDAYLWLKDQYGDFVFDFEYKHPEGGNSGAFFRVGDLVDPVTSGIEVQILDSYGEEKELGHHDLGGVIKTQGPSKNMAKPPGEWNRMTITCQGTHLKVVLNGEQIQDLDLSQFDSTKDKPLTGFVGLQDHGLVMWFRNIRIKAL